MNIFFVLTSLVICLLSSSVNAITVDKMELIASKDKADVIRVSNEKDYPVAVEVALSKFNIKTRKETSFKNINFKQWPVIVDNYSFVIDPKSYFDVHITALARALHTKAKTDEVVGISFIPKSYKSDNSDNASAKTLQILTGFKSWYIIPNNNEKVTGDVDIVKAKGKNFLFSNNTDTTLNVLINACDVKYLGEDKTHECSGNEIVLPGHKKTFSFSDYGRGDIYFDVSDGKSVFHKKLKKAL